MPVLSFDTMILIFIIKVIENIMLLIVITEVLLVILMYSTGD